MVTLAMIRSLSVWAALCSLPVSLAHPPPRPPPPAPALSFSLGFSDGAVLQRDVPAAVYGRCAASTTAVNISLTDVSGRTVASVAATLTRTHQAGGGEASQQDFRAVLPPQPKGWGYTLAAAATGGGGGTSATLRNVSFGDVHLCMGGSAPPRPRALSHR